MPPSRVALRLGVEKQNLAGSEPSDNRKYRSIEIGPYCFACVADFRQPLHEHRQLDHSPRRSSRRNGNIVTPTLYLAISCCALRPIAKEMANAFIMVAQPPTDAGAGIDGDADVRGLGCGRFGSGAVRFHDVVPHRIPGLLDRARQLSGGT